MDWITVSLILAILIAFWNFFLKKSLKTLDVHLTNFSYGLFSAVILFFVNLIIGFPEFNQQILIPLIIVGSLSTIFGYFYLKSIHSNDLSKLAPLQTFTPLFLIFSSWIILGEKITFLGFIGILLIITGSYFLSIKDTKHPLKVFKEMLKNKGTVYILLTSIMLSIMIPFDKIGILNSSPFFWAFAVFSIKTVLLFPFVLKNNYLKGFKSGAPTFFLLGLSFSLLTVVRFLAFSLGPVTYVNSFSKLNIILSIILGYFFFKEKGLVKKIPVSLLMILGVILINLS